MIALDVMNFHASPMQTPSSRAMNRSILGNENLLRARRKCRKCLPAKPGYLPKTRDRESAKSGALIKRIVGPPDMEVRNDEQVHNESHTIRMGRRRIRLFGPGSCHWAIALSDASRIFRNSSPVNWRTIAPFPSFKVTRSPGLFRSFRRSEAVVFSLTIVLRMPRSHADLFIGDFENCSSFWPLFRGFPWVVLLLLAGVLAAFATTIPSFHALNLNTE